MTQESLRRAKQAAMKMDALYGFEELRERMEEIEKRLERDHIDDAKAIWSEVQTDLQELNNMMARLRIS